MKKVLLAVLITATLNCTFAQTGSLYFYYQGKKITVQQTYKQLVIGVKKETSFAADKNELAAQLQLPADSLKKSGGLSQFVVRATAQQQAAGEMFAAGLRKKAFVTYVHPCLTGQGSKLVSYGDGFVVKVKPGMSSSQLKALLATYHCIVAKQSKGDRNTYLISAGPQNNYDALKMANTLYETGRFEYAQPDFTTYGGLIDAPNDPLYSLQWAHHNTGSAAQYSGVPGDDIKVDSAWTITKGDEAIKIAVIDTGVDTAQADLKDNLLQGYDCITQTANTGDGYPKNPADAHGTSCAGIVAAKANNGIGIAGIAPNCKLIPVSISDESGFFTSDFNIASGIDYSWQNGADVLTNSWTLGFPSNVLDDAIHRAVTQGRGGKGCIVFFGSGNDYSGISYPSSNPEVISVGGSNMFNQHKTPTSSDGEYWWGASYGNGLDVVAPCVKIATTDISGGNGYNTAAGSQGDYNLTFNGTSSATPHAAGVAALVLSVNKNYTAANVRAIIENNCTKPTAYTFTLTADNVNGTWNNEMGYGIVNAYASVQAAQANKFCGVGITGPADVLLCKNSTVKLNIADSNITANYTWRLNGASTQTGTIISVTQPGLYDVVAEFANGCSAQSATVHVYAADTAVLRADAGKPISICPGNNGVIIGGEPSARGGSTYRPQQRAYGYDLLNSQFMRFNIENPRSYKNIPVTVQDGTTDMQFIAGDFTPLGYYAITRTGTLARIDTASGYVRFIGQPIPENGATTGKSWAGLSWNPVTKKLYGNTTGGASNKIYEIDPITGRAIKALPINTTGLAWATFNSNGSLYGYYGVYNNIVKILSGGGVALQSKDIGVKPLVPLDGSFDPVNGKLYFTTYAYGQGLFGDLREMDTVTANFNVKGDIAAISEVSSLAISGGNYRYMWEPATGLSNTTDANPVAKPTVTTTYFLTVTDACGAVAKSQVVITANAAKPAIKITAAKDSICIGDSSRIMATKNDNYTYQWMYNGTVISNPNDSFVMAGRGGNFQVSVTNGRGGCSNTSAVFKLKDCSVWLNNNKADTTCFSYLYPPHGFVDTGFRPGETFTKTIYPLTPGARLKVSFDTFVSTSFSYLKIYDGPDTTGLLLKTLSFYDYLNPRQSYTSSQGPLTFKLIAGVQPENVGNWNAFLTCVTPHKYLSKQSGDFDSPSTWTIQTGENTFEDATVPPAFTDDTIIIRTGHTVTLNNTYTKQVDELWVQKGAYLILNSTMQFVNAGKFALLADGDVTLSNTGNTAQIPNAGDIHIRGNLTTKSSGNSVASPVYADGTGAQTFLLAGGSTISSLHVVNKTGITIQGHVTIDSLFMSSKGGLKTDSVFLRKTLVLDSGIVHTQGAAIFDITSLVLPDSVGNKNSYIDGPVSLGPISAAVLTIHYPVGTATNYRPVTMAFDRFVNDFYTVQAVEGRAPALPLPADINAVSMISYYKIKPLRNYPIANLAITIPYNQGDSVTDPAHLRIVRDSASKWMNEGGVGTGAGTGSITSTRKITYLGSLALANATGGTNTLPVTWLNFSAALENNGVLLHWDVANEMNINYYTVEYSTDGSHFITLSQNGAYTNSRSHNAYQYLHTGAVAGVNQYRIKETDKDGKFTYSKTINVHIADRKSFVITPNPTSDFVVITANEAIREIDCYNTVGQLVKKISPAANSYKLSMKLFAGGVYTIKVVTAAGVYNGRVIKQ